MSESVCTALGIWSADISTACMHLGYFFMNWLVLVHGQKRGIIRPAVICVHCDRTEVTIGNADEAADGRCSCNGWSLGIISVRA